MGDKRSSKRKRGNKNNNKENLSPYESESTSPSETRKRKEPKSKSSKAETGARVTRSKKTKVNNDAQPSASPSPTLNSKTQTASGTFQIVSKGDHLITNALNCSGREEYGKGALIAQQRDVVPANWEDNESFFTSPDEVRYVSGGAEAINNTNLPRPTGDTTGEFNQASQTGPTLHEEGTGTIQQTPSINGEATNTSTQTTMDVLNPQGELGAGKDGENPPRNEYNEEVGNSILQTLATMNVKLQKIDVIEALALETRREVAGVNTRIDNIAEQLDAVKADLRCKESKWESDVTELQGKVSHLESGCHKIEKSWDNYKKVLRNEVETVQSDVGSTSTRLSKVEQELAECKQKLAAAESMRQGVTQVTEQEMSEISSAIEKRVHKKIKAEIQEGQKKDSDNRRFQKLRDRAQANKFNLIVFGLPEPGENESDSGLAADFFSKRMGIANVGIERAFRLGPANSSSPGRVRPTLVKFKDIQDRWAVWKKRGELKQEQGNPVWIQEDLPRQLRMDNRKLQRIVRVAKDYPDLGEVKIRDYGITVKGKMYHMNELHLLPNCITPEAAYTPKSDKVTIFFTKNSPLSNHHASPFSLEGQRFVCVEQYLAVHRAFLANDKASARQAMGHSDPVQHKLILNALKNNQPEVWKEKAEGIILEATRAKFTQNSHLADFLVATHPLQIGEASMDEFWGTGLTLENKEAMNPAKWSKNGNLLGRTLERIREELIINSSRSAQNQK